MQAVGVVLDPAFLARTVPYVGLFVLVWVVRGVRRRIDLGPGRGGGGRTGSGWTGSDRSEPDRRRDRSQSVRGTDAAPTAKNTSERTASAARYATLGATPTATGRAVVSP